MKGIRSSGDIVETLKSIRRGEFLERCNEQLTELNKAVFLTDGEGELTITLKLKPNGEGQVLLKPKVKVKKPIKGVGDAIFFVNVDGGLEREDPRQGSLLNEDEPSGGGRRN